MTCASGVCRATVGPTSLENTHPFHHGRWIFADNGTVPSFEKVRFRMLEEMDELHRTEISGQTDSEHVFRYLLSLFMRAPGVGIFDTVRYGLDQIIAWCAEIDPSLQLRLNIVLTDGEHLVGSRLDRTLYHLRRDHLHISSFCGKTHVKHDAGTPYRAVEVA